tara:strand:- start:959 stop:1264 length:306 start_codon:yes stop_codon:yes gene_type:complete
MTLIDTTSKFDFMDRMLKIHDNGKNEAYSIEGLEVLWNYYDEIENVKEFYPAEISSEWTQYNNMEDFRDNYSDAMFYELDDIRDKTIVLIIDDDSFLVSEF